MAKEANGMDFYQRFSDLRVHSQAWDSLVQDLMQYAELTKSNLESENSRLAREAEDAKLDLADATLSRRELQKRLEITNSELSRTRLELELAKNRNPYVTILIDGDGLIFSESYVRKGIEGGKAAAYALRAAVAAACNNMPSDIEISAKIIANMGGLARAMARDGALENPNDLRDFTQGFNQAKASFDFIDVGYGKERADSKIREITRWHLQNTNCKQILLGISHDAGYAPFLDEILRDETIRRQVSVLEGVPTVRDLVNTGVNIFKMDNDLFRDDKLADRSAYSSIDTSPNTATTSPQTTASIPTKTPPPTKTESPFSSYANMATKIKPATPPPQLSMPLPPRAATLPASRTAQRTQTPQTPKWNPGARGLDKAISVDAAVLETVKKRKDNNKLCNNHFLRGAGCAKGDSCTFVHRYKPTQDELNAIAFLSRLNPCTMGQDCDAGDCIYGHHCPHMKDNQCTHPYCKFPMDAHPPNTKFRNAHITQNC